MHFVGRKRKIQKIIKTIERGANVIVQGKYGIGRTSLIRNVSRAKKDVWHFMFVDFSDSSGKMCKKLLRELLPEKMLARDRSFKRFKLQSFKTSHFLITNDSFKDKRKHIIVLDNVAKTTNQKVNFIRTLAWAKRFQFVAIIEPFLPQKELLLLRAELIPADIVQLSYLPIKETCEFFKHVARKNKFDWTDSYIRMLAQVSKGYPLGMMELCAVATAQGETAQYNPKNPLFYWNDI
jgi:hypothetical protein